MANGRFIVCNPAIANEANQASDVCADCGAPILVEGARDAGATYICQGCLEPRLARDEPDEVEVPIPEPEKAEAKPQDTLEAARECQEMHNPGCGCAWCLVVNPIAKDIASAVAKHKGTSKLAKVEALVRVLGEAAVVYKGHSFWHRDAAWTTGLVSTRLLAVADREATAFYEQMRPLVEEALQKAGVDLSELVRDIPKDQTH